MNDYAKGLKMLKSNPHSAKQLAKLWNIQPRTIRKARQGIPAAIERVGRRENTPHNPRQN